MQSSILKSRICHGHVMHCRLEPVKHAFTYPLYFYSFDLDELPSIQDSVCLFGYNQPRLISIHDKDYLEKRDGTLKQKLQHLLGNRFQTVKSITLVTVERYFNYTFNPVSFFLCYRADRNLECVISEVNNTHHEMHLYMLDKQLQPEPGFTARYQTP